MSFSIDKNEVIDYPAETLRRFHCFTWESIDNLNFTMAPEFFLDNAEEYIEEAKTVFRKAGWEGDGEIRLIWIPPFSLVNHFKVPNSNYGVVLWHVKQLNDGISWILSPIEENLLICPWIS